MAEENNEQVEKVYVEGDPMLNAFYASQEVKEEETKTKQPEQSEAEKEEAAKKLEEESKQEQAPDFNKFLEEKTGGKYKTIDEILAIKDEVKEKDIEFANEESKKLYEAIVGGKEDEVYELLQKKNTDYNKVPDQEILYLKYKKEHPGWDEDLIRSEISDTYAIGEKVTDDDAENLSPEQLVEKKARIARAERRMKGDAGDFRTQLESERPKFEIPIIKKEEVVTTNEANQNEQTIQMWMNSVDEGLKTLPSTIDHKFVIEIPDGEDKGSYSTQYEIAGEDKKMLDDYVKSFIPPMGRENDYVKDGKVDVVKIKDEGIEKLFSAKMYKTLLKESLAKVKQSVIEGIKNIDTKPGEQVPEQEMTHDEWLRSKAMSY